jgi:hypothetical protein
VTAFERRWAVDLLSAFAPTGSTGLSPLEAEVDYLAVIETMRRRATRLAALGLRAAIWLLALAPIWHRRSLRTISALPASARASLLSELLVHRAFVVRELSLLLKLCASMALLGTRSVRARSGYDDVHDAPANQSGLRKKRALDVLPPPDHPASDQRRTNARSA